MLENHLKQYSSAPLPFMRQKRRFIKDFKEALKLFDKKTVFVDLFGGSGLLSHVAKRERPDARVIYNDYDDYHIRLKNIDKTNKLLADIGEIVAHIPKEYKLPPQIREAILHRIKKEEEKHSWVDYTTLSSSVLFSTNYVANFEELKQSTLYNNIIQKDYNCNGYLEGLEVVKYDYRELFEQFKTQKNVVFIVDPPYLSTKAGNYKNYWKLADYLDVLNVIKDVSYIYFTSNKSSIIELLQWLEYNLNAVNPLYGAIRRETRNQMNYYSVYKDIMLYKNIE